MKLKRYSEVKGKPLIPSILSADFANLGEDIRLVSQMPIPFMLMLWTCICPEHHHRYAGCKGYTSVYRSAYYVHLMVQDPTFY